jgi:DNA-directed RNA polymerase subunit RPC12/RpoP
MFDRLLNNEKIQPQDKKFLEDLSIQLNQEMPKYACPHCWFKRLLENFHVRTQRQTNQQIS